jgi:hypothetical protein
VAVVGLTSGLGHPSLFFVLFISFTSVATAPPPLSIWKASPRHVKKIKEVVGNTRAATG